MVKLLSVDDLAERLGPRPRRRTVVLAHGVFDIVHPGHIRHLRFAREQGQVLVASVTADEFVTKGNLHQNRPYVPEELRAENLAALEMVDFVVIDRHATPVELIGRIQPDVFTKGYEYVADGLPASTQGELAALQGYGGEMVFSPGDVVYSSTEILNAQPPRLSLEKLLALLASEGLGFADLRQALEPTLMGVQVHVVGDTIVDTYSECTILGPAPKSAHFCVKRDGQQRFVGGAGIVAKHLQAAGATVTLTTVVGQDELAEFVLQDLVAAGVYVLPLHDHTRPTTEKERLLADGQHLLQLDTVDNRSITNPILGQLRQAIRDAFADVVVFCDFRHGMFNRATIPSLTRALPKGVLKVADSQVSNRWGNILDFQGFDLITPNEREARFALGDQDSVLRPLASHLYSQARCRYLLLKLGEQGLLGYRPYADGESREFFPLDSFVTRLVDAVGAGDALLAHATLTLARTGNIVLAAILGSLAAAIACERLGNVPVSPAELAAKLRQLEGQP